MITKMIKLFHIGKIKGLFFSSSSREQFKFLMNELEHTNIAVRHLYHMLPHLSLGDAMQSKASFDYQWKDFHEGIAMPDDAEFMKGIETQVCNITGQKREWFKGKRVVDVGCGSGRYSFGLLKLGADVLSCDQSDWALARTAELCKEFGNRHRTKKIDLLKWDEAGDFDLAFCFGVAHHTGNTYLAIDHVAKKVKPGGKIFLMLYGYPNNVEEMTTLNLYEDLRHANDAVSFDEKKKAMIEKYGKYIGHGMFDAVSPRINELLSFNESRALLERLGFSNIRLTIKQRNHHMIADKG